MKKTITSLFLLVIHLAIFSQTPFNLKFNLKTGNLYQMKVINKQNIQTTYNGTPFTTEVNSNIFISYTLLSQDKEIMNIEFRFDTIYSKTITPAGTKITNSATPAKGKEYLERLLNRFSTGKIIAKISTSGKFIGFTNYKPFRDNFMLAMDSVPENKRMQIQKQADMLLKESSIQSMIEPVFAYLPDKAVSTGEKWETTVQQSSGGMTAMMFNTFTLNKVDNRLVYLTQETEIESVPSNDPNAAMSTDIKGKSTAELEIDKATGVILKSTAKSHSAGNMKIKNQGNEMTMPIVVDSQSEVKKVR